MLSQVCSIMVPTDSSGISVAVADRRERSQKKWALEDRARALWRRAHSNTEKEKHTGMYVISINNPPGVQSSNQGDAQAGGDICLSGVGADV